jgi:hypothetical protein
VGNAQQYNRPIYAEIVIVALDFADEAGSAVGILKEAST